MACYGSVMEVPIAQGHYYHTDSCINILTWFHHNYREWRLFYIYPPMLLVLILWFWLHWNGSHCLDFLLLVLLMVVSGMVVSTRLGLNDEDVHFNFPLASFGAIFFQGAAWK